MNKSTKKIVVWQSIVGGGILLLLLILSFAKVISFIFLFVGFIVILILSSIIITIVIAKKKKLGKEGEEKVYIKDGEARIIAKEKLYDKDILEYEKELIYEKIGHFGTLGNEVPVYIRKIIGLFEGNILGILVNMKTKQTSFKFYDETKISSEEVDTNLEKEANLLVARPLPSPKMRVVEESSPLTGITKTTREPIEKEIKKEEQEGGLE